MVTPVTPTHPRPAPFNLSFDAHSKKSDHHTPECTCVRLVGLRCARRRAQRWPTFRTPAPLQPLNLVQLPCVGEKEQDTSGRARNKSPITSRNERRGLHLNNALTSCASLSCATLIDMHECHRHPLSHSHRRFSVIVFVFLKNSSCRI